MKGIKTFFLRECKANKVEIEIGERWCCCFKRGKTKIVIPEQNNLENLFFGLHELGHAVLHSNDSRNYDDLFSRIEIEREADQFAYSKMDEYKINDTFGANNYTLGLIALYMLEGNTFQNFEAEIDDRFIVLKVFGLEIFSQFISNLPMHPVIH